MRLIQLLALFLIMMYFSNKALYAQDEPVLVKTIDTSNWIPPSPDPAGIVYLPVTDNLLVSDSEVNEIPGLFTGINIFLIDKAGTLLETYTTTLFSNEPTGISVDNLNNHYYFSDDDKRKIFNVDLGPDVKFNTNDDKVVSFSTTAFGSNDPEGVSFGDGKLFIADGVGKEVYVLSPGGNGTFDGVSPEGDDIARHFDTSTFNQDDPEGIAYNIDNKTLFIVSRNSSKVSEVTQEGALVRNLDLSFLNPRGLAGITYARTAAGERRLYVTDRGVDNNSDPNENDGKIYVIKISGSATITPSMPPCPQGDANGDCHVDGFDYVLWWQNFGNNVSGGPSQGDFNRDGTVDGFDYVLWWQNFGT